MKKYSKPVLSVSEMTAAERFGAPCQEDLLSFAVPFVVAEGEDAQQRCGWIIRGPYPS